MAIQTAMAIRNKGNFLLMAIRNYSVHRVRPLLPYGAILLFLGGIWFLWDGPSEGRQETIREQKMDTHFSAPDFSYSPSTKTETSSSSRKGDDTPKGRAVYTLTAAQRHKPLGTLFAAVPKGEKEEKIADKPPVPVVGTEGKERSIDPSQSVPVIQGIIDGDVPLVILGDGKKAQVCGAGDFFDGWYVCYVNVHAVGLERNGRVHEFSL